MTTRGQPDRVSLVETSSLKKDQCLLEIGLWRRYTYSRVRLQCIDSTRPIGDSLPAT